MRWSSFVLYNISKYELCLKMGKKTTTQIFKKFRIVDIIVSYIYNVGHTSTWKIPNDINITFFNACRNQFLEGCKKWKIPLLTHEKIIISPWHRLYFLRMQKVSFIVLFCWLLLSWTLNNTLNKCFNFEKYLSGFKRIEKIQKDQKFDIFWMVYVNEYICN